MLNSLTLRLISYYFEDEISFESVSTKVKFFYKNQKGYLWKEEKLWCNVASEFKGRFWYF